jgi:hypothetical protein
VKRAGEDQGGGWGKEAKETESEWGWSAKRMKASPAPTAMGPVGFSPAQYLSPCIRVQFEEDVSQDHKKQDVQLYKAVNKHCSSASFR